jgi:isopentenyldiphosphate isomerase
MMKKELWDLYDQSRRKLNKTVFRGDELPPNTYHLVVHVCYFNNEDKMLIQKRSSHKTWGGLWDVSIGGAVTSGETSQLAAHRESLEELGINHDFTNIKPHLSRSFERGFDDIYLIDKNINIKDIKFNDQEACDAKWATKEEIFELIEHHLFLPIHEKTYIDFLYTLRKNKF